MRWHRLSTVHIGGELDELLAASSEDGIGVIARWKRRADGWDVEAMDTEGESGMQPVTVFRECECVPPEPPAIFDDVTEGETK